MNRPSRLRGALAVALLALFWTACTKGGDGGTAPEAPVATITLSQDTATLVAGANVTISATLRDSTGATVARPVVWSSSVAARATVTGGSVLGTVTGVSVGATTITANSEGKSASATVTVKEGALIGAAGGTVTALGGVVTLTIPAGALTTTTMITAESAIGPPSSPRLVPLTAVELGPTGRTFTVPVQLRLRYDVARLPAGPPERLLTMHRGTGGAWQPVGASTVDLVGKTVTASLSGFSPYGLLTAVFVESVSMSQTTAAMTPGQVLVLSATPRDGSGNALADRDAATWSSNATSVATVSNAGVVTAVGPGNATITALIEGRTGTAQISVSIPVNTVTVTPPNANISVGGVQQYTATLRDINGNILTRTTTWSSSNNAVATVNANGLVTGVAQGQAVITATSEGRSGTAIINVTVVVVSVLVTPNPGSAQVGGTLQMNSSPRDGSGNPLAGRGAPTWATANAGIATVNQNGLVTGVAVGVVVISATIEGVLGTATVNVTAVAVASVLVTPNPGSVQTGSTLQMNSTPRDAGMNPLTGRGAPLWASGNTALATVSQNGLVTGVAAGAVTITANIEGVVGSATVNVTGAANPCTIATLPSIAVGQTINASLDVGDCLQTTGEWSDGYILTISQTMTVQIDESSQAFDTYLVLARFQGGIITPLAEDDDGGAGLNSQITISLTPGTYIILATSFDQAVTGPYAVSVFQVSQGAASTAARAQAGGVTDLRSLLKDRVPVKVKR